jgi:hypothetical protein
MGYRSNGLVAVKFIEVDNENEQVSLDKIYKLAVSRDTLNENIGKNLLLGLKNNPDNTEIIEQYDEILQVINSVIELKSLMDGSELTYDDDSHIIVFEYSDWKWNNNFSGIARIEKILDLLREITDIHFIRIGEYSDDVENEGTLDGYFYITTNYQINF